MTPEEKRAKHAEYMRKWRAEHPGYEASFDFAQYARNRRAKQGGPSDAVQRANWKATRPEHYLWRKSKDRARIKGFDFDLTEEWIKGRIASGHCEATGLPFDYAVGSAKKPNPWSPSIDRQDSSRGYLMDNCRVVCWLYNVAKGAWQDEDVEMMAFALIGKALEKVQ